jgi:hypothetical protein
MKLILRRRQAERKGGIFGGHKGMGFALSAKVELTPAEQKLVETYDVDLEMIAQYEDPGAKTKDRFQPLRLKTLINGHETSEISDVTVLVKLEEDIKNGVQSFKALLQVMEGFAGEQVIEY